MKRNLSTVETFNKAWIGFGYSLASFCLMAMVGVAVRASKTPSVLTSSPPASVAEEVSRTGSAQRREYDEEIPKTVFELQQFRQTSSIHIRSAGGREGSETLINLNPTVNAWYVLEVTWNGGSEVGYHFENPARLSRKLVLDEKFPLGIVIEEGQDRYHCSFFGGTPANVLEQAAKSQSIFAPLCENRLYLRNPAKGQRTALEGATKFLRNQVWGGEKVIVLFHHLMEDTHRETGKIRTEAPATGDERRGNSANLPMPALIDPQYADRVIASGNLGISAEDQERAGLRPGSWYPASGNVGVYVSLLQPDFVDPRILQSYKKSVSSLDRTEVSSLCYLVAFDLDHFDLSFEFGTDFPGVGWSEHIPQRMRDPSFRGRMVSEVFLHLSRPVLSIRKTRE